MELIVDTNAGHDTERVASETLTLTASGSGGPYLVSAIVASSLHDETSGPHVVQVTSSTQAGVTTLQVSFDSDLAPDTVAGAIAVLSASGAQIPSTTVYDPNSRTATVTVAGTTSSFLTIQIATSLGDVEGQTLAHGFQAQVGGGSGS